MPIQMDVFFIKNIMNARLIVDTQFSAQLVLLQWNNKEIRVSIVMKFGKKNLRPQGWNTPLSQRINQSQWKMKQPCISQPWLSIKCISKNKMWFKICRIFIIYWYLHVKRWSYKRDSEVAMETYKLYVKLQKRNLLFHSIGFLVNCIRWWYKRVCIFDYLLKCSGELKKSNLKI